MEKFALLNLLKALETLAPPDKQKKTGENEQNKDDIKESAPPAQPVQSAQPKRTEPAEPELNVMASVLTRHEQISNRIKNKK